MERIFVQSRVGKGVWSSTSNECNQFRQTGPPIRSLKHASRTPVTGVRRKTLIEWYIETCRTQINGGNISSCSYKPGSLCAFEGKNFEQGGKNYSIWDTIGRLPHWKFLRSVSRALSLLTIFNSPGRHGFACEPVVLHCLCRATQLRPHFSTTERSVLADTNFRCTLPKLTTNSLNDVTLV